ncbi:MAG: hypothetical protein EOM26_10535 [Alphaproteobacteria bacterium]|nr:hypothetical protein [Alphaproteobacteria bacterium]
MRQTVFVLMAFLVLTLSLACGMASCPVMAANEAVAPESLTHAPMPCHGEEKTTETAGWPMVVADCLDLDFSGAAFDFDFSPDDTNYSPVDFLPAILLAEASARPESSVTIRGPPGYSLHGLETPLFLTTRRLRI